jgi:hypothetical protein
MAAKNACQQSRQQSCLNCASPPEVDKGLIRTSLSKCILLKVVDSMVYVDSITYFTAPEVGQNVARKKVREVHAA